MCVCVKFCFLLGKSAAETVLMLQEAFKEEALSKTQVYEWYSHFKGGEMSCEDQPRSRRPSTCQNDDNLEKVCNAINADHRRTSAEISQITGLSWSSCQQMLTEDLNTKRVSTKFVPQLLTEDKKNKRLKVSYDLREQVGNDPQILSKVVTGEEIWCYSYDLETKQALSQWKTPNSPKPKKAQQVQSNIRIMLSSFFDANGIVHKEFVPPGQTVNQQFYLKVLKGLCDSVQKNDQKCGAAVIGSFTMTMPLPTGP